jgi:hypothetical protein
MPTHRSRWRRLRNGRSRGLRMACYVRHINRTYRRTGTLWEGCYRATAIDSEWTLAPTLP